MAVIVKKYGGSSLADAEKIKSIAVSVANLKKQGHQIILVVSAMGNTTNQLIELAYSVASQPNRRELDMLLSTGERISTALTSMALNEQGCPAISFTGSQAGILTDNVHNNARIQDVKPIRLEHELFHSGKVVVLAGFQGVSPLSKEITTLGRGGTDTSAMAMAAYFKAERCEMLKDVDGVMSADPKIIKDAKKLPSLGFLEALDMTYWGAKIIHFRAVEMAYRMNIPIYIGLAHGQGTGCIISNKETKVYEQQQILSINSHKEVLLLNTDSDNLSDIFDQIQNSLDSAQLSWPQIICTEQRNSHFHLYVCTSSEELSAFSKSIQNNSKIKVNTKKYSSLSMTCHASVASNLGAKVLKHFKNKNIQVYNFIPQAMSLSFIVAQEQLQEAIQAAHEFVV